MCDINTLELEIPAIVKHSNQKKCMIINGSNESLEEKTFEEIGILLRDASPNKDGIGLTLQLTGNEELIFGQHFGVLIGQGICNLIAHAIKDVGGNPLAFRYTYENREFRSFAV